MSFLALPARPLRSEAIWAFVGQVGVAAGNLAGLKLLTHLLPKETFGQINLLTVGMILPGWVLFAPLLQAAVRMYAPSRERNRLPALLRTTFSLYGALSVLVIALGLALIGGGFLDAMGMPREVWILALTLFLAENWLLLGTGAAGAARLRSRVAGLSMFSAWARPLIAWLLVLRRGPSVSSVFAAYLVATVLLLPAALIPLIAAARKEATPWVEQGILSPMLRYARPYALWSTLSWGQGYVDRYVLELKLGTALVGPYAAAFQVATLPFNLLAAFLSLFITPIVFERAGAGDDAGRLTSGRAVVRRAVWLFAAAGGVAIAAYAAAGTRIMGLLTQADYVVSGGLLAILGAGALARNLAQLLSTSVLAHNEPTLLIWAFLIPGLLSAPLSLLLVGQAGAWGAALANAAASIAFLAMVGWLLRALVSRSSETLKAESGGADLLFQRSL